MVSTVTSLKQVGDDQNHTDLVGRSKFLPANIFHVLHGLGDFWTGVYLEMELLDPVLTSKVSGKGSQQILEEDGRGALQ